MTAARVARSGLAAGLLASLLLAAVALSPRAASAEGPKEGQVRAVLDGKAIPLVDVGRNFCHDFAYPEIRCFSSAAALESSLESLGMGLLLAGVTYVTIYDYTTWQGSYMHVSEDYWALSVIGWNDRISSFIARNYESGAFWTDWLYSGTKYNFCCNQAVSWLGGYDNSFSSVYRN
jgi:hypothetical protein